MKLIPKAEQMASLRHSLRGECGLKFAVWDSTGAKLMSLSARRVWIEINETAQKISDLACHSLRGECGLKFFYILPKRQQLRVTLCEESVD